MTVQVTDGDLVLLGHGSYSGGADNIELPENIDFYILQPVGYTLKTDVAEALINQEAIDEVKLVHENGGTSLFDTPAYDYIGGGLAPNLHLYPLGSLASWGEETIGDKCNVITVTQKTSLDDLLKNSKVVEFCRDLPTGKKLKLFWSACAAQISGNSAEMPD